jgi:hypothetical protein
MKQTISIFVAGVIAGALVMFLVGGQFSPKSPTKTMLKVTGPDGKSGFQLNVEGESIDYEKILNAMFASEFLKGAASTWLATKQNLYPIDSDTLVTAIATKLCEPIPDEPLAQRLAKGRECANKGVVSRLRALAFKRQPPFHYVGVDAQLGIPAHGANRPPRGRANVCRDGDFFGRKLQVANPRSGAFVEVEALGSYVCTPAVRFPDVQLSPEDARVLFGSISLNKFELVTVVPIE